MSIEMNPSVSVIIPVYNSERYLAQCLDSVRGQTLKDIEIICVDDGSTDKSSEILSDYAARDERYWLTKSAVTWANEKYEYCYVFAAESFSPELAQKCMEWAWNDMLPRVKPHSEHQCTNAKVVLISDRVSPETAKTVKRANATKSYRQGIKPQGYSNLLAGVTDLETRKTMTNSAGHELVPYFKKLFAARA